MLAPNGKQQNELSIDYIFCLLSAGPRNTIVLHAAEGIAINFPPCWETGHQGLDYRARQTQSQPHM